MYKRTSVILKFMLKFNMQLIYVGCSYIPMSLNRFPAPLLQYIFTEGPNSL